MGSLRLREVRGRSVVLGITSFLLLCANALADDTTVAGADRDAASAAVAARDSSTAASAGSSLDAPAESTEGAAGDVPDSGAESEPAGWRARLAESGIAIDAAWYGEWTRTLDGGRRPRHTTRRTFLDVDLTIDTEPLVGWPGGKFRWELWRIGGDGAADGSGAIQDPSSLRAERRLEIGQVWFEQSLPQAALRIRVGKMDPTYDFAVVERGWDFVNSAVTYAPNLNGVPVYPDTAYGVAVFIEPESWLHAAAGVFDGALQEGVPTGRRGPRTLFGAPADLCALAELRARWQFGEHGLGGRAVIGGWFHDGTFAGNDGTSEDGTFGTWAVFEQRLTCEVPEDPEDEQGLAVFARTTIADRAVGPVRRHDGCGVVWTGAFDGRDEDVTGFAILRASPGSSARRAGRRAETVFEAFHKFQVTPCLSITPDVQFVDRPWGGNGSGHALVAGLRLVVVF